MVVMTVMREEDIVTGGSMSVEEAEVRAADLLSRYGHLQGISLIEPMVHEEFNGKITMTSSFGTEAAALLALVSEVDPNLPVIFLDTRKLFGETHRYREQLVDQLGLTNIQIMRPDETLLAADDPNGMLFASDTAKCCYLRKVEPLQRALKGYDAWLTGRKRFHGGERGQLPVIETAGTRIKINPLAGYRREDIEDIFENRALPRHPLEAEGFLSIGCMPCTDRVDPNSSDVRAGRWAGQDKTECGIHYII
ncbi:phosphoadenosine phosphosulfate reductase [Thalassospira xianhensis MCCC 1A02616]|uniref:Adenosine 5'-phosphosulfate reductase n=2 Tax=Thalassospira xianhensis TaxID=478503 RepID=A0A367UAY9_9PROT|nr:phosphoadenylyl-sulfate reductase [Thalassospira xianhensis]RCK05485.1 phosphoadenosine phosphosulfate reductase [Thalassospira xianhensis MCCC 1A02616]